MNAQPEHIDVHKANRALLLHHELFYPAFLGAALFEFARKIFPNGTFHFFHTIHQHGLTSFEFVWFVSALWFILYFSVAFIALAAAKPESFPPLAFLANLLEIGVILATTISIEETNEAGAVTGINYRLIYWAWIIIPITAGLSNVCSKRTIHTFLSVAALLLGVYGLLFVKERVTSYFVLLVVMYLLLLWYYYEVFSAHPRGFFVKCNLPATSPLHKWVEQRSCWLVKHWPEAQRHPKLANYVQEAKTIHNLHDPGAVFDAHVAAEFVSRDIEATMATMADAAYVTHVPVMTGGCGRDEVRRFYTSYFIGHWPTDTRINPISRTIGQGRVIDEFVLCFTHDMEMPTMLPGIAPTGRKVELPHVVVMGIENGKVTYEHIYWDQASLLTQVGLLDPAKLPVAGVEQARKLLNPKLPSNELIHRAERKT